EQIFRRQSMIRRSWACSRQSLCQAAHGRGHSPATPIVGKVLCFGRQCAVKIGRVLRERGLHPRKITIFERSKKTEEYGLCALALGARMTGARREYGR